MFTSIKQIKSSDRNDFNDLEVDFQAAIKTAYRNINFSTNKLQWYGGSPDIWVEKPKENEKNWTLCYPDGEYKSNSHYNSSGSSILAVETAKDCRLNLVKKPLFLLKGRVYNGSYKSLLLTYFLFGQNEDNSFFCHKIRPSVGRTGNLETCRQWIWQLKQNESIKSRQGDVAFIPTKVPRAKDFPHQSISLGNHHILGNCIKTTKHRVYVLNPISLHSEHNSVDLKGWFELRLARAWKRSTAD